MTIFPAIKQDKAGRYREAHAMEMFDVFMARLSVAAGRMLTN
jgi:hypothetical protein